MAAPSATRIGSIVTAALCLMLLACGKSVRTIDDPPRPKDGGDAPVNCAYPKPGVPDAAFLEEAAALAHPGCSYQLGPETELPFEPGRVVYAFSFDVNGDGIGDIFFREGSIVLEDPPRAPGSLRLAVSSIANGSLSYVRTDCEALAAIPDGRVFVRDLNGDDVPDLVVGPTSYTYHSPCPVSSDIGVQGFLNLPSGFVEVFRHEWPENSDCNIKTALLDVEVGDFGGLSEEIADIAFGYDRVFENALDMVLPRFELGVAVSQVDAVLPTQVQRQHQWLGWTDMPRPWAFGQFAVGGNPATPWLYVGQSAGEQTDLAHGRVVRWEGGDVSESDIQLEMPGNTLALGAYRSVDAWILPFGGPPEALAVLYPDTVAFYDVSDSTRTVFPILLSFPTAWLHFDAEASGVGSGIATATRFMIDIDGDGDVDFVERGEEDPDETTFIPGQTFLTVHPRGPDGTFGPPMDVPVSWNLESLAESPFVRVGAAEGAIVVNCGSGSVTTYDKCSPGPPTFQVLECAPE